MFSGWIKLKNMSFAIDVKLVQKEQKSREIISTSHEEDKIIIIWDILISFLKHLENVLSNKEKDYIFLILKFTNPALINLF